MSKYNNRWWVIPIMILLIFLSISTFIAYKNNKIEEPLTYIEKKYKLEYEIESERHTSTMKELNKKEDELSSLLRQYSSEKNKKEREDLKRQKQQCFDNCYQDPQANDEYCNSECDPGRYVIY